MISTLVFPTFSSPDTAQRQCSDYFPQTFPTPPVVNATKVNDIYQGWNIKVNNTIFVNGKRESPLLLSVYVLRSRCLP